MAALLAGPGGPRAHPATTAALAAAFEDTMRALFAAGLPVCGNPALRRSPEYRCLAGVVGWWLTAAPATVVSFARSASARLTGGGGGGGEGRGGAGVGDGDLEVVDPAAAGGGDPFGGAAPAALVAWPDTPWRASALALLRAAAASLPGGGGPGAGSVLARLEVEEQRLAAALERLVPEDDGAATPGAWSEEDEEGWARGGEGEAGEGGAPSPPALAPPPSDDGSAHALLRSFGLSPSVFGAWAAGGSGSPAPVHPGAGGDAAAAAGAAAPRARTRSRLGGAAADRPRPFSMAAGGGGGGVPARPCLVVPDGLPASHWWWHGRTPAEAARARAA